MLLLSMTPRSLQGGYLISEGGAFFKFLPRYRILQHTLQLGQAPLVVKVFARALRYAPRMRRRTVDTPYIRRQPFGKMAVAVRASYAPGL
jgi:hypothetical protein